MEIKDVLLLLNRYFTCTYAVRDYLMGRCSGTKMCSMHSSVLLTEKFIQQILLYCHLCFGMSESIRPYLKTLTRTALRTIFALFVDTVSVCMTPMYVSISMWTFDLRAYEDMIITSMRIASSRCFLRSPADRRYKAVMHKFRF